MQDMMTTWRFALPNQDAVDQIRQELAGLYPDLDTAAFGVVGRILRLARNIETWRAEHLSAYQLTPADFNVLATMRRKGDDGINPGALLNVLFISSGGLTRRLDRLEAAGLIVRHPDPEDRGRRCFGSPTRVPGGSTKPYPRSWKGKMNSFVNS